ncbi:MAG: regulatory signaling modulator protein AmpE [Halioglobus sp.]|nr:regulatory signaling modulator protein AmpE [Halioglobus sp.]
MTFLALIIALVLLQLWGSGDCAHRDNWFYNWRYRVGQWSTSPAIQLAAAVLAPAVLAQLLLNALEPVLFGLLWIGLAVWLLLYSLGRGDFRGLMERYRSQCRAADFEGAYLGTLVELGGDTREPPLQSFAQVDDVIECGFLYEGYQRWFAPVFYFVLFGPAAALAYRLLQLCGDPHATGPAARVLFLADWAPARLLALAFALTGDFVASRDDLLDSVLEVRAQADQVLCQVGVAAVGSAPPPDAAVDETAYGAWAAQRNRETAGLLWRSAICWVAVLALLVLFL